MSAPPGGVKDAGLSISVGGQVVEMILTVEMLQAWHGDSLYHLAEGRRHKKQCLRHPAVGVVGCFRAKAAGGFGLTFLLPAVLGHNSDLDIVGQADHPFHQTAAKNHGPSLLLGPGKEDLGDFVQPGKVDQSPGHIFAL